MKKYQKLLYTNNDIDYNINGIDKMNYLIKN